MPYHLTILPPGDRRGRLASLSQLSSRRTNPCIPASGDLRNPRSHRAKPSRQRSEWFRSHPGVSFPDDEVAGYALDTAPKALPGKQPRIALGTSSFGNTPGRWRNPGTCQPRSTRRCCCRRSRGSDSGAEADWCKRPADDCPRRANPYLDLRAYSGNDFSPARQDSMPCSQFLALRRNLNKWSIDVGFLMLKFCVRSVG